jgi:ribokinase
VPEPRAGARVIVVGSINLDLVVTIDHLPAAGETVTGGRYAQHHGGKGANQAVAAARLDARVSFIGAVGDDAFGVDARDALASERVDVEDLVTVPGVPTGVAMILVDEAGENCIAVASGANHALSAAHVEAALARLRPTSGDAVLVSHEIPTGTARVALRLGRDAGASTILNPAPADGLDAETVGLADILTPNRGESAILAANGLPPGPVTLVSHGADGARLRTQEGETAIPAPRVTAVDTVGAGDALNGALAAGLAAGYPLVEAARRAVVAAGLAVTRPGARGGMPTAGDLEAALRRAG